MSHLSHPTAIFSPSVARLAALAAKDWNYVDGWLAAKFHGRAPPPFERNPDTLKALLALAALNESADENRDLVAGLERAALRELDGAGGRRDSDEAEDPSALGVPPSSKARGNILAALEDSLTREGRIALDAMAAVAVDAGAACPVPEVLGRWIVDLHAQAFELKQASDRVAVLQQSLEAEAASLGGLLQDLRGGDYQPAPDLAKQNLDTQRRIRSLASTLPEPKARASSALSGPGGSTQHTIEQVKREEEEYSMLLAQRKELHAMVQAFQGLPPDPHAARQELEDLRGQLRSVTRQRDAIFEGLVERESPYKGSRMR